MATRQLWYLSFFLFSFFPPSIKVWGLLSTQTRLMDSFPMICAAHSRGRSRAQSKLSEAKRRKEKTGFWDWCLMSKGHMWMPVTAILSDIIHSVNKTFFSNSLFLLCVALPGGRAGFFRKSYNVRQLHVGDFYRSLLLALFLIHTHRLCGIWPISTTVPQCSS